MLELDFGIEHELFVESVPGVEHGAQEIQPGALSNRVAALVPVRGVLVGHFTVTGDRNPLSLSIDGGRGRAEPEILGLPVGKLYLRLAAAELLDFLSDHLKLAAELLDLGRPAALRLRRRMVFPRGLGYLLQLVVARC